MNRVAKINPIDNPQSVPKSFWKETKTIDGIKCHRHPNGGGWVAETAKVDESAFVGMNAMVYGKAHVYDNARVSGNAQVFGYAHVSQNAQVSGNAQVYGNAHVYGDAWVFGYACVYGNARVYEKARVYGDACVSGYAWVYEDAWVYDNAQIRENARVYGKACVFGDALVYGDAWVFENAHVSENVYSGNTAIPLDDSESTSEPDPIEKTVSYDCLLDKIVAEKLSPDMVYCLYDIVQGQTICKFNLYGNIQLDMVDSTGFAFMNMDTKRIVFSGRLGENCGIMEYNALFSTMTEIDPNKAVYNTPEVFLASF